MAITGPYKRSLWHLYTTLNLPEIGQIEKGNVIITHASGESEDPHGGVVNTQIAQDVFVIQEYRKKLGLFELPILSQGEAALVMVQRGINVTRRLSTQAEYKAEYPKGYIQSKHVAWWHEKECKKYGWDRPILVSHQFHLPRAYWVTLKQCPYFKEIIVPHIKKFIPDKKNKQARWRWLLTSYCWEMAARTEHLVTGVI